MHEIHTSERRSFRGCRRRWDWAYRDGYVPHETAKPLEFGIAFHEALDVFYDPDTWESTSAQQKLVNAQEAFKRRCEEQRANFLKVTNQRELEVAQGDDYEARIELGLGMLRHHVEVTHARGDNWFKPVATEISFAVPLLDPQSGLPLECHNSPSCGQVHENQGSDAHVIYAGRVDMLIEDTRYGGYFVWDHKTAAQLATDDGFLQLDDQVGSYCWALQSVLGLDVKGFVYAEYRKAFPSPPEKLKRLNKGCAFSTSKAQGTTAEVYIPYVMEHDAQAFEDGNYDEFITWLKSADAPKFHQRFTIIKTDRELENIGKMLTLEAMDMIEPGLRIYPSVGRYSCGNCAYRQPCLGQQMGEDYQYTLNSLYNKVEHRYYHQQKENKGE